MAWTVFPLVPRYKTAANAGVKKPMKNILFLAILVFSSEVFSEVTRSWWLDYRYEPTTKQVLGLAAKDISKDFEYIAILKCGEGATFSTQQCSDIEEISAKLTVTGDFNKNGVTETFYSAVAKDSKNTYYKVILVFDVNGIFKQALYEKAFENTFSVLIAKHDLIWGMCLYCGHLAFIKWIDDKWHLDWADEDYGLLNKSSQQDALTRASA